MGDLACSLAFSVDDGGTDLLVLVLGNPLFGEVRKRAESRGTLPDGVLSGGLSDNTDVRASWESVGDIILQSGGESLEHGGSTGEDEVLGKFLPDIDISGVDGFSGKTAHTVASFSIKLWLEEELWAHEPDSALDGDDTLVWEGVGAVVLGGGGGVALELVELSGGLASEAVLLLDVPDDFHLGGRGEILTSVLEEKFLDVFSEDATGDIHSEDGVGE